MELQNFVGRQSEINLLSGMYKKTLMNNFQICFISGVAGDGKTALAEYFSEYVGENNKDVVAVVGRCNAQTGPTDTYLPFREIMGQFTSIQAKMVYGTINKKKSTWPSSLGYGAARALIEYGPDLIGTFVPGSALITRATFSAADQAFKKQLEARSDTQDIQKERIRAQYAGVLQELSKKYTLILILDDLQWADDTSLDLLLYLCKSLKKSSIFIIGTFRSDDVALGRDGAKHPLESILNEIKTEFGKVVIDLSQSREKNGQKFIAELLESHKCQVSQAFIDEFFNRTRGLPLFAIELLHDLQDRGILVVDDTGRWTETKELDWNKLPAQLARLDGLIESRLDRLSEELRDILNIASIEGQDFTAQVIMQMQKLEERPLLRKLSQELGKQHNLVSEIREVRVGSTVLSKYRFLNSTFQQYIYDDMSLGERRLLHTKVAETLEELYKGNEKDVAMHLARHYENAYEPEKVVYYLNLVAEQFSSLSEYAEAQSVLEKALSIAKTENYRQGIVDSLRNYAGKILIKRGEYDDAQEKLLEALSISKLIEYREGEIFILRQLGIIARRKNRLTAAATYYLESLAIARQINDLRSVGKAINNLSIVAMDAEDYDDAKKYLDERLKIAEELNDIRERLSALINFGDLYVRQRKFSQARVYLEPAFIICEQLSSKSQLIEVKTLLAEAIASENPAGAKDLLMQAINSAIDSGEPPRVLNCITSISSFLYENGRFSSAYQAAHYVIRQKIKSPNNTKRINALLANYDEPHLTGYKNNAEKELPQVIEIITNSMNEIL